VTPVQNRPLNRSPGPPLAEGASWIPAGAASPPRNQAPRLRAICAAPAEYRCFVLGWPLDAPTYATAG